MKKWIQQLKSKFPKMYSLCLEHCKAMGGQMPNFSTTVAADMRFAQRDTETEAHSHTDSVIVDPKAK